MKLFAEALERKGQPSSRTNPSSPPQQHFESKNVGWRWLYDPFEHPDGSFNFAGCQPEEAVLGLHLGLQGSLSPVGHDALIHLEGIPSQTFCQLW